MKLYGAIDLHSDNNVTVVIDEQDQVVYQKRLPNDLAMIVAQLSVYQALLLVQLLLEKSRKSVAAATALANGCFTEAAISRAYYAAFFLAQAALTTKDISRSKHSGVIAAFGEHLTQKGLLPEALHKTLLRQEIVNHGLLEADAS